MFRHCKAPPVRKVNKVLRANRDRKASVASKVPRASVVNRVHRVNPA